MRAVFANISQPATWAVADLQSSTVAEILADGVHHEIGLLAADAWSGPAVSRRMFYQGLLGQLQQATAAGVAIASIVTNHADPTEPLDLLSKHGIRALRTARPVRRAWSLATVVAKPVALRFGIWKVPTAVDFVRDGARAARAALRRAARYGETVVVCGDVQSIAPGALDRLLRSSVQFAAAGRLQILTLSAAADALARRRQMTPAQSILRAA